MLNEIFVSEVRVKILKIMLPVPNTPFHVRALVRAVGTEINAIRRELERLNAIGLLKRRPSGNRVYYTVNTSSIYYPELLALASKEQGLGSKIIQSAKSLGDVKFAMVSKAFCKGRTSTILDIDLFIVGSLTLEVLEKIIAEEEKALKKEIHYSVMGEDEFLFRKRKNDQFVMRILTQSRIMLLGDEEEFCSLN